MVENSKPRSSYLCFQVTGNEERLQLFVFPKDYDVSQAHEDAKRYMKAGKPAFYDLPGIKVSATKLYRLAINHSDQVVIDPTGWQRSLEQKDKGTPDSNNWPDPLTRKTLRLGEEEKLKLESIASKYFQGNKTVAIVWCLRNFNALLNLEPDLLNGPKLKTVLRDDNSKLFSLRLSNEMVEHFQKEADQRQLSMGRVLREALTRVYNQEKHHQTILSVDTKTHIEEPEDFDFDLDNM